MIIPSIAFKLIGPSAVNLRVGDKTSKIDGFAVVDEKKLRELADETVASLTKRGVLGCVYAHLFSMSNFSDLALTSAEDQAAKAN